ncbi:MAG: phosphoribosylformylglycinamidine synthase subunit PurS [Oligoflexia bacterium]|nr:phosphoribosylformylglycinamidine synthase subunit PurS [Oligoflexia bacterium]
MRMQVLVRLKSGVLDVQGKAVEHALASIGFQDISEVRVGRLVELEVEAGDEAAARQRVIEICEKLLVNSIIENFELRRI